MGIIGGGGSAASAITASSPLGIRNGLYGLQLKPILRVRGLRRLAAAQLTIDESTGCACAPGTRPSPRCSSALPGDALGDPRQYGLDAAAAGAFLGLLWPRLSSREPVAVAVGAAIVAAVLVPAVPAGIPVVVAAAVAVVAGLARG